MHSSVSKSSLSRRAMLHSAQMQSTATDVATQRDLCVCVSACVHVCVGHISKPCKNGRTHQDAVWEMYGGPNNPRERGTCGAGSKLQRREEMGIPEYAVLKRAQPWLCLTQSKTIYRKRCNMETLLLQASNRKL